SGQLAVQFPSSRLPLEPIGRLSLLLYCPYPLTYAFARAGASLVCSVRHCYRVPAVAWCCAFWSSKVHRLKLPAVFQGFAHPPGPRVRQGRGQRPRVVDPFVVAAERIDAVEERLQVQGEVGVRGEQRHGDGRQATLKMTQPHATSRSPLGPAHQERGRAVRPGGEHGQLVAAAEQVDLDEVGAAEQQGLTFALVLPPTFCVLSFVGRG